MPKARIRRMVYMSAAILLALLILTSPALVYFQNGSGLNIHSAKKNSQQSSADSIPAHSVNSATGPESGYHVSLSKFYNSGPAPMGIADYGYSSQSGAYRYNSTSFLGTLKLNSMYVYNSTSGSTGSAFQLNLMLNFSAGGNSYTYWIQDVAAINSGSNGKSQYISFIDNVWNFSSSHSTSIYPSSLRGNGSVYQNTLYYAYASNGLAGSNITVSAPVKIELKADSNLIAGVPEVSLMYNDGYGWVTYDNIYFTFASGASSDSGFVVSGYSYNKLGLYYDAELILGGPGNGSSTKLQSGSVDFSLQYWNGHNYQFVPNAWNYGSDTAETIYGSNLSFLPSTRNASLYSSMSTGVETLGQLYSSGSVGDVNISLPYSSGTAYVNNAEYNYTNYGLNLTLMPGVYNVTISPASKNETLKGSFSIRPGQYLSLNQSYFGKKYTVKLNETGLEAGTPWTVVFANGTLVSSDLPTIAIYLQNGTYTLIPNSTAGYRYTGPPLIVTVDGSNQSMYVNFSRLYKITFNQTGLHGVEWFVNLSGNVSYELGDSISFNLTNGTYNYSVIHIKGYTTSPDKGILTVNGSAANLTIRFIQSAYTVTVKEHGLPDGYNWSLFIDGSWHYSNDSILILNLSNGTYAFAAYGLNGSYTIKGSNATISVAGSNETVGITFISAYNSGINLDYKLIYVVFLAAVSISGTIAIRRRQ